MTQEQQQALSLDINGRIAQQIGQTVIALHQEQATVAVLQSQLDEARRQISAQAAKIVEMQAAAQPVAEHRV